MERLPFRSLFSIIMGGMQKKMITFGLCLFILVLTACQTTIPNNTAIAPTSSPVKENETQTSSPVPPTATPIPLPAAAIVNDERILLSDFEEEVLRYQDALLATNITQDEEISRATVLENLIDLTLLAQASRENGQPLSTDEFTRRLENLKNLSGGSDQLQAWMTANHYSVESFERLLRLEMEAALTREKILADVPRSVEQIHARQIMVQSKARADEIFAQLQAGADFATLSWIYDPLTGGELSWFPRNYLVIPEIEEAVFALQPGEYTNVIATDYGYQIVQVIEKESERALTQDALLTYQRQALADWVQNAKSTAQIEILIQ